MLISENSDQQSLIKIQLDRLENTALNLSTESTTHLTKLREDILRDVGQLMQRRENLEDSANAAIKLKEGMRDIRDSLKTLSSMMSTIPRENIILRNLFFASMNLREEAITNAEDGTFEWIFEEENDHPSYGEYKEKDHSDNSSDDEDVPSATSLPNPKGDEENDIRERSLHGSPQTSRSSSTGSAKSDSDKTNPQKSSHAQENKRRLREEELKRRTWTRACFLTWLRAGGGVFHISGKAGSGKSTLMKFLCGHERTEEELDVWAGEKKLVFARFFFWQSQDKMQMSLAGLYRSILFETLKRCPELIPIVFPTQWVQLGNYFSYVEGDFLGAPTIQKAFEILTTRGTFPRHRFCFFVDGLDEYHGDSVDHVRLAKSLQLWASGGDVKICASSRPYLEFEKLSDSPDRRIHLHELTRHDIYLFSRQMLEKDENFEQIKDAYLLLVDKVIEMSEGVFLWARLAIRSLLTGMLRHDTVQALEKKLEVIPRDINDLYDRLLGSLEPDDRERAVKMLLLTAHNPFMKPLNSVVYAWIDNLSDPHFPPTDGNKPSSWPPVNDITQNIQRQLISLTKGLLEATPMGLKECGGMHEVQFFHRTLRDFVLENSKLEDVALKFPSLTKVETYCRLWLAEMVLAELPYRLFQWNSYMVNCRVFQQELPLDLLNGFSRILDCSQDDTVSCNPPSCEIFHGSAKGNNYQFFRDRLSFVHMAAYTGQKQYVFQEISKSPELLNGNGELHILLSAAVGNRKDIVLALLQRGASPTDCVNYKPYQDAGEYQTRAFPIWLISTAYLVGSGSYASNSDIQYEILELFLDCEGVDASCCWFLMTPYGDGSRFNPFMRDSSNHPASHFITLKQFVKDSQPPNMERLLALLNRRSGNSYFNGARHFLSRLNPLFKETESVMDKEMNGYTRFHAGYGADKMWVTSIICGDLRMDSPSFRVY